MKSFRYAIPALACLLSSLASVSTIGQSPIPDAVPLPPAAVAEAIDLLPPPPPDAPAQFAQATQAAQEAFVFSADAPVGTTWSDNDHFNVNVNGLSFFSGASKPRTLVIRSNETEPKTLAAIEEDLNVMSRILSKAAKEKPADDDALTAMGMKIRALTIDGNASAQNLYLDGYGALFMLHVRFPLLAPPEPAKEDVRAESTDSTWDEARRELYGPKESTTGLKGRFFKDNPGESYDAKKVTRLKEALVESLKNAANIRNLKPDEHITIVVLGKESAPGIRAVNVNKIARGAKEDAAVRTYATAKATAMASNGATLIRGSAGGETVMTIRAKKSDVDAYAKGTLKPEDFQKKVSIATY